MKKVLSILVILTVVLFSACCKQRIDNDNYEVKLTFAGSDSTDIIVVAITGPDSYHAEPMLRGGCFAVRGTSGRLYGTHCGVRSYQVLREYPINR